MSVSVLDGKVLEAPIKFNRKGVVRYSHLLFELPDGGTERIGKQVAGTAVAEPIAPGAEGRFYLYKVLDVKGIHGVRLADGAERYAYPGNNAGIFLGVLAMSAAWMALRIFDRGDLPLLGVLLFGFGIIGFFLTRSSRVETKRQFDGDERTLRTSRPAVRKAPASAE